MTAETIGTALVQRRRQLNIGMAEAAARIAMSRTTYSSYEHDRQRPSVDVLPVLADFLNVSTNQLLALYGATSIAVIRPSLEQFLAAKKVQAEATADSDATSVSDDDSMPTEPKVAADIAPTVSKLPAGSKEPKPKKKKKKGKRAKG